MSGVSANDHFSEVAAEYATFRPDYPAALFAWLAGLAPSRRLAWDCATGNGQAAASLSDRFGHVIATDISTPQIGSARRLANVAYAAGLAERSPLPDGTVDCVTVAQALHWFDPGAFHAEVRRVCVPGGVVAAWCYELPCITPAIDVIVQRFATAIVGSCWPPHRKFVDDRYESVPFPHVRLDSPPFEMTARWRIERLFGYMGTWSAARGYRRKFGTDPVDQVREELGRAWGDLPERNTRWPLHVLAGRVESTAS